MKTFFSKRNIWIWIVLFLLILNISVISTILVNRYKQQRILSREPAEVFIRPERRGLYLRNELNLTDEQFAEFGKIRMDYQRAVADLNAEIHTLREAYWNELMKNDSDTGSLAALSDSIGRLHTKLIGQTGEYYDNIRDMCDDRQRKNLNSFFMRAMQTNDSPPIQQRRNNMQQQQQQQQAERNRRNRNFR